MIRKVARSDIYQRIVEDNSTLHNILWILEDRDTSFLILLGHIWLIIMGGLFLMDYDEAMSSFNAHTWHRAMKGQLESLYSNIVWVLIEAPKSIKPIGVSWFTKGTKEQMERLSFIWLGLAKFIVRNIILTIENLFNYSHSQIHYNTLIHSDASHS